MTDPNEKTKIEIPTREPKKKTPGIFDNLRKLPERHPVEEILGLSAVNSSTPSTPSTDPTVSSPSTASTPSRGSTLRTKTATISPERDYTKVANSIVRVAVPTGVFGEQGGKSKELYDYLYQQTRGAVVPRRRVRIPKDKLMRGSGIGSEVTLRKNLVRLRAAGLIIETIMPGTHGGNEYEVFMPEEVGLPAATPSTGSTPSTDSNTRQIREPLPSLESRASSPSVTEGESTTSGEDKTLSKDLDQKNEIDDDEAFADYVITLKKAVRELTGREASPTEAARWREVADVLVTELKIAAARTTVSSVPAFLAEHLRRRLFKKDKRQIDEEAATASEQGTTTMPLFDANKCPDCGGTKYWYPEGYEKGVVRCQHEKLLKREAGDL